LVRTRPEGAAGSVFGGDRERAIAGRARRGCGRPATRSLSSRFPRPSGPGPARLEVHGGSVAADINASSPTAGRPLRVRASTRIQSGHRRRLAEPRARAPLAAYGAAIPPPGRGPPEGPVRRTAPGALGQAGARTASPRHARASMGDARGPIRRPAGHAYDARHAAAARGGIAAAGRPRAPESSMPTTARSAGATAASRSTSTRIGIEVVSRGRVNDESPAVGEDVLHRKVQSHGGTGGK
jgi:hypothetical protein